MKKWRCLLFALAGSIVTALAQPSPQIYANLIAVSNNVSTAYGTTLSIRMSGYNSGHIYYTTNGTAPTISSPEYTAILTFTNSIHLRAVAYNSTYTLSSFRDVQINLLPLYTLSVNGMTAAARISIDGGPFGTVGNGIVNVGSNQTVTVTAVDTSGWQFYGWTGRHPSSDRTHTFQMDISQDAHLVMYRPDPLVVPVIGDGEVIVEPPPYFYDDNSVQITAVPHAGSFFAGWSLNGESGVKPTGIAYTQKADFGTPTAYFSPLLEGTHSISVQIDGHGTVLAPTRYFSADGDVITVRVQPPNGSYITGFTGVTGPGTNSAAPPSTTISFTLDSDKTALAHVKKLLAWTASVPQGSGINVGGPEVVRDDLVVMPLATSVGTFLRGFGPDGRNLWEVPTLGFGNVAVGFDGTIYQAYENPAPDDYGSVSAYSSDDGTFLWNRRAPGPEVDIAVSETNLYVSSGGRRIQRYALDGTLLREVSYPANDTFKYFVLDQNSNPATLGAYLVDLTDGLDLRWAKAYPGALKNTLYTDANGNVITGDLRAYDGQTGANLWNDAYTSGIVVCLGTNRVFIADSGNGQLSALDLATGQKLWSAPEPYPTHTSLSRAVAAADGSVFALYSFLVSPSYVGSLLRKISPAGEIVFECSVDTSNGYPILTPSGRLYFGAFGYDVGVGPAPSGFPMPRGDWRNSGKAYLGNGNAGQLVVAQSGENLHITFTPVTSATLSLQWSEDLVNWSLEKSFSGPLDYTVPTPLEAHRFYRVVAP